jgi:hypothetical protein
MNGEIFTIVKEAQIVTQGWRQHYNRVRPHAFRRYTHEPMFIVLTFIEISFEPYDLLGVAYPNG